MDERAVRFDALDSWRGIAAVLVALFHFEAAGYFFNFPLIRNGNLAVPFFFVLSGFVITHAYRRQLDTGNDGLRFMVRRFGRLYPLHFITLAVLVLLELLKMLLASRVGLHSAEGSFAGTNDISSLIANVFLLQAVIPYPDLTWNASSWSISTEFYTYILFILVFIPLGRYRMWGCAVVFVLSGLVLIWLDGWHSTLNLASGLGMAQCVFGFFAGNLTYEVYLRLRNSALVKGTVPELIATVLMILLFWIKPHYTTGNIIGFSIVILLFAFEGGLVARLLRARPLLFLGQLSYSIYLVHFTIFSVIFAAVRVLQGRLGTPLIQSDGIHELMDFGPKGAMDLLALAYIVAVVLCACITYYYVEVPGRVFFNRLSKRIGSGDAAYGQGANAG